MINAIKVNQLFALSSFRTIFDKIICVPLFSIQKLNSFCFQPFERILLHFNEETH